MCATAHTAEKPIVPQKGEQLEGKVIGVTDGDTLTLLVGKEDQYKIRLEGIDAPEKDQPFGMQSKKALSDQAFGKTVRVLSGGPDKYGRTLGIIFTDHCINTAMVRDGWAWHYKQYSDSKALAAAEEQARAAKAGLWADAHPIPPWDWRHNASARRGTSKADSDDPFDGESPAAAAATKPIEPAETPAAGTAEKVEEKFWITISSGVRHNSDCRYYENSKGRHCTKDDGRPCKICGG